MFSSTFFRRLFLPYLLLICLATGVVGFCGARWLRASYLDRTEASLRNEARLVEDLISESLESGDTGKVTEQAHRIAGQVGCRVTIIDDDGTVEADSEGNPDHMDNHRQRPEMVSAATSGEGSSVRTSATIQTALFYFARRAQAGPRTYFVRLSVRLDEMNHRINLLYGAMGISVFLAMAAAGLLCFYFARKHTAPLVELTDLADALAHGQLSRRILSPEPGEMGTLARSLNSMADALGQLIAQTDNDRARLLAILSSMSEGVIATDTQQRVLLVNAAAGALLDFPIVEHNGALCEMVRSEPILRAASEVLSTCESKTFQLGPSHGHYLEVTICTFPAHAKPQGVVIVARDTTQSMRYQELRKEFVANVSHELRTPLTAIKGFAETLREGAMHDPVHGPKFLATIENHVDQLTNLVNDLLELSKLDSLPGLPRSMPVDVGAVVRRAADLLTTAVDKKSQTLNIQVINRLPAVVGNPDYLERAVANLIDNAVKYTPTGGTIQVTARSENGHVTVEVSDNGIGIPKEDLPRIFERFYRVDRSRSREMGGTGLGLSIVKHIAQAHGGAIEVSSTPGSGSSFRFKVPIPGQQVLVSHN